MEVISVKLAASSYPIVIGAPMRDLPVHLKKWARPPSKVLVVTHPSLKPPFGKTLAQSLERSGIRAAFAAIPEGEKTKNLETVRSLYQKCLEEKLDRSSAILALGGGVAGDIAGFLAATYLRGIGLIQVPTTLLAMVDSSIGGKTGVDLAGAKNYVGAFYQPKLVWIDPSVLKKLPRREMSNGMAEMIKYGVIADRSLFGILEKNTPEITDLDPILLSRIIALCARIKARVVSEDEKETKGLREILNFGHTWGHAIEAYTGYGTYKHGEAISIGMRAAGSMAEKLGLWDPGERLRLENILRAAGLPLRLKKKLPSAPLLAVLRRDKKNRHGKLRFVLPVKIGRVVVREVTEQTALLGLKIVQP